MFVLKLTYFTSIGNLMDFARIVLTYYVLILHKIKPEDQGIINANYYIEPILMAIYWIKFIMVYLPVYEPVRYLVQMITVIINDIKAFMLILISSMLAQAHIVYIYSQD